jgi:hypothetical protein
VETAQVRQKNAENLLAGEERAQELLSQAAKYLEGGLKTLNDVAKVSKAGELNCTAILKLNGMLRDLP